MSDRKKTRRQEVREIPIVCAYCGRAHRYHNCPCRDPERNANARKGGRPWRRLRARKLNQNPFCERCDERGYVTAATEAHHVVPVAVDPSKELDINNLQSLCRKCHQDVHSGRDDGESKAWLI